MNLYTMAMKYPDASVVQNLWDTKSSVVKSYFGSLILFSESALPRYESYMNFAEICREAGVPCQRFVNHSDVAGGSTLGNILASSIPLRGVDMGNAILAMHSCRETGSVADHEYCVRAFTCFYSMN